jgi:hypothetical protein
MKLITRQVVCDVRHDEFSTLKSTVSDRHRVSQSFFVHDSEVVIGSSISCHKNHKVRWTSVGDFRLIPEIRPDDRDVIVIDWWRGST